MQATRVLMLIVLLPILPADVLHDVLAALRTAACCVPYEYIMYAWAPVAAPHIARSMQQRLQRGVASDPCLHVQPAVYSMVYSSVLVFKNLAPGNSLGIWRASPRRYFLVFFKK
jgi:hypothetical protein